MARADRSRSSSTWWYRRDAGCHDGSSVARRAGRCGGAGWNAPSRAAASIDCLFARQEGIDLVLEMPVAGVALRFDRAQPQLAHQSSDAPASDGNRLARQGHRQRPAAIHRMLGENTVEPGVNKAASSPTSPAAGKQELLRTFGQLRPPLRSREMAGCPARKSRSTCSWPTLRCRSSTTFCASSASFDRSALGLPECPENRTRRSSQTDTETTRAVGKTFEPAARCRGYRFFRRSPHPGE
jgi:hypothetical protein